MQYPLDLRFKIAAIASQIYVTDASGNTVFYVKQKLFKLKENIEIYTDSTKTQKIYTVKADRIIDFSPEFTLYNAQDQALGSVKRFGRKSIWKSNYEVKVGPSVHLKVQELNPWAKVADSFFGEIPFVGMLSGYFFHPKYSVTDATTNQPVAELEKRPAFLEGLYRLDHQNSTYDESSQHIFAALMMVVVLRERMRG